MLGAAEAETSRNTSSDCCGPSLAWTNTRGAFVEAPPPTGPGVTAAVGVFRLRLRLLRRPRPSSAGGEEGGSPTVEGWMKGVTVMEMEYRSTCFVGPEMSSASGGSMISRSISGGTREGV